MAYATEAELTAYPVTVPAGASAALLLTRASRDVDRALLCAVYDVDDSDVQAALRDATIEQVAGMIASGDLTGSGATAPSSGFSIGRITVQRGAGSGQPQAGKIDGLWPQAYAVLQAAGLTGQGPQERVYGLG